MAEEKITVNEYSKDRYELAKRILSDAENATDEREIQALAELFFKMFAVPAKEIDRGD